MDSDVAPAEDVAAPVVCTFAYCCQLEWLQRMVVVVSDWLFPLKLRF